jgi:hypothetical protein
LPRLRDCDPGTPQRTLRHHASERNTRAGRNTRTGPDGTRRNTDGSRDLRPARALRARRRRIARKFTRRTPHASRDVQTRRGRRSELQSRGRRGRVCAGSVGLCPISRPFFAGKWGVSTDFRPFFGVWCAGGCDETFGRAKAPPCRNPRGSSGRAAVAGSGGAAAVRCGHPVAASVRCRLQRVSGGAPGAVRRRAVRRRRRCRRRRRRRRRAVVQRAPRCRRRRCSGCRCRPASPVALRGADVA